MASSEHFLAAVAEAVQASEVVPSTTHLALAVASISHYLAIFAVTPSFPPSASLASKIGFLVLRAALAVNVRVALQFAAYRIRTFYDAT